MTLSTYTEPDTVSSSTVLSSTDHNAQIAESIKHLKGVNDSYTVIVHAVGSSVSGGTATASTWNTRPLTSIRANTNIAGLVTGPTSDRFTLQAGVWKINARCAAYYTTQTLLRLYNVTDAGAQFGFDAIARTVGGSQAEELVGGGIFKITASKTFELQMYCTRTQASNGLGFPNSVGTEIYCVIELVCIDKD